MTDLNNYILPSSVILLSLSVCYVLYRCMVSTNGYFVRGALGLTFILVLLAVNVFLFRYVFGLNYFIWFLKNGPFITLSFAIIAVIWDELNINTAMIECYPPRFIAGCLWLAAAIMTITGIFGQTVGTMLQDIGKSMQQPRDYLETQSAGTELRKKYRLSGSACLLLLQAITAVCVTLTILFLTFIWCLTVAPILYFFQLISGAPARMALETKADRLIIIRKEDGRLDFKSLPQTQPTPENAAEISFSKKPFALTSALSAALIWIVNVIGVT